MIRRAILLLGCVLCGAPLASGKNAPAANAAHRFSPPTALDTLLDANPVALPAVKPASDIQAGENPVSTAVNRDTTVSKTPAFQIQLDALSDIDSAQARKSVLEQTLGGKIEMVFDPPFYKLRFGSFSTKQEAEDALADLAEKNLKGFVVRH